MSATAVVLFSGGMDSTIALFWARQQYYPLYGIGFLYGQRHSLEIKKAQDIWRWLSTKTYGTRGPLGKLKIINLPRDVFAGTSSLLDEGISVSKYDSPEDAVMGTGTDTSYIPARNPIFLSIVANHLLSWSPKGGVIVTGLRGRTVGPVPGFPDCTMIFTSKMSKALTEAAFGSNRDHTITIQDPLNYWGKTRAGSIEFARKFKGCFDTLAYTLTCFEGWEPPCGKCLPCQRRRQAFEEVNLEDPLMVRLSGSQICR